MTARPPAVVAIAIEPISATLAPKLRAAYQAMRKRYSSGTSAILHARPTGSSLAQKDWPGTYGRVRSRPVVPNLDLVLSQGALDVPAAAWDALVDENDPFLEHGFLAALERSGSVGE